MPRSNQTAAPEQQAGVGFGNDVSKSAATLEGLTAQDPFPESSSADNHDRESDGFRSENGGAGGSSVKDNSPSIENHIDVSEDEGWIAIPYKEIPDNWTEAPDILSFRSLDRSFVFPGYKQDTEIITPFKVAAVMNKNGIGQSPKKHNIDVGHAADPVPKVGLDDQDADRNGTDLLKGKIDSEKDVDGESLLRMEDHRRQTDTLLGRFRNSHFFVRIAESREPLWSKRRSPEESPTSSEMTGDKLSTDGSESRKTAKKKPPLNAAVDKGCFDAKASGGVARNVVKCCSLSNGDLVVLLQVNIGVEFVQDPVLEILQFEKYQEGKLTFQKQENLVSANQDPCGDLLKWLLPLDNSVPPPVRSLSPPPVSSISSIRGTSTKPNSSGSSGSQIFSFGHFRSYSMSSIPQNTTATPSITTPNSRPNFELEDWDRFSSKKFGKSEQSGNEGLLSFRGVSLEPERFSVCCGLEGIYTPGRRWRRKIEIIQPVEIHSFSADCNTEDLLCVQIKNVSPTHAPDIVVYLDAITIVFEEASKGGPPISLPFSCIEAGNDHSLPNLALRRGEEHSFILKPATSVLSPKVQVERGSQSSYSQAGNAASSLHLSTNLDHSSSFPDQYAILVSCRCDYTESRLFFKQPTSWRPRVSRDLLISVASEMSRQTLGSNGRVPQLPVQVLTLQASNLTSEDLTLTVFAPASFTTPPSVVSLNSSPSSPMSPYVGSSESAASSSGARHGTPVQRLSSASIESDIQRYSGDGGPRSVSLSEQAIAISDVLPRNDLGCTHLWLQSRVPLGCVPSRSTATIKLELLPLTDGIITLDSLQIYIKEKGLTYIPEYSLKINATSSVATGI
ncbi:hypothetical protein RJ640_012698, partial [Escallonia rubra]